jgi:hypothetical protein
MRVSGHPEGRLLGYVELKVASRVFKLPVEAAPIDPAPDAAVKPGFFSRGIDHLGILVDAGAPEAEQQKTVERASADATAFISRTYLN